jgi:hypothetical protein
MEDSFYQKARSRRHPQNVVDKLLVPLLRDWDNFSVVVDDFIVAGRS